jgi:eukaryotic-like serine/threonine-protein kinase
MSSDGTINKLSRRSALVSIAGATGLVLVGCGPTTQSASSSPTPTPTPATPTPIPATPTPNPTPTRASSAPPGTSLVTYKGHTSIVWSIAWSPDSQFVASADQDGTVQVWSATTGKQIFTRQNTQMGNTSVAWSANGKYIASASYIDSTDSSSVSVWDARDGSLIARYNEKQAGILILAFSPDSRRIAAGSFDSTVHICYAATGEHILTYNGHKMNTAHGEQVVSLSWSPDGTQIVSSSSLLGGSGDLEPSTKVWNTTTGKDILIYSTANQADAVAWSPSGTFIASEEWINGVETVQIWAPENGRGQALTVTNDGYSVQHISWSPNNKYLALSLAEYQAVAPNSRIEVRSATGGSYKLAYTDHQPSGRCVAWSPDGSRIASGSLDTTVQIWQAPA